MMSYFTLPSLFLNTELWPQKCVPIKGDMMYFLPCSETHSSPWTKKKTALTLSPPLLPFPIFLPSSPQHSPTLFLYAVLSNLRYTGSATFWQELQEQLALSLLATK